ncbi:unnamed protein product [Pedinophyceae sp. YPF-701]|nr:unnamed protein product [Pedinophyceae sp. YPF-701]
MQAAVGGSCAGGTRARTGHAGPRLRPEYVRAAGRRAGVVAGAMNKENVAIMVNSCTGKMGLAAAEAVVRAGVTLVPYTLTGESTGMAVSGTAVSGIPVEVVGAEKRQEAMDDIKREYPNLLVIDYTLPSAVNDNGSFYAANSVPFVMGTTGGDRERLYDDVGRAGTYAVIAPQMGKQIVAFQAMMKYMADNFPGAFSGYKLEVVESHQKTKADTSGTAKAVVEYMNALGPKFDVSEIQKVRDEDAQLAMGVPREHLSGHAYHTYRLTSPDGTVGFEFQHNVCGRTVYAEGTVDAALFLAEQVGKNAEQKVYSMLDVLSAGAMR